MLFWRWRSTPRATRRSLCSLFGDNWSSSGSWRWLHSGSSDSLSNRSSRSLNRCSGDNWCRCSLCWCSGSSLGSGGSFVLLLLICLLLGLLGGIFELPDDGHLATQSLSLKDNRGFHLCQMCDFKCKDSKIINEHIR